MSFTVFFDASLALCSQKYRRSSTFVTWGHTTRVIFTVKICIFERSNEKSNFSKTKIYFHKKNYTIIIRTYWATKYESRRENKIWATCHNISSLFDGCWHPLLSQTLLWLIYTCGVMGLFLPSITGDSSLETFLKALQSRSTQMTIYI